MHGDFLTSMSSYLTQLFSMIRKLSLWGNGIKILRAIDQSNHNIHKFNLWQTLQKYLRTFLNKFKVMMILDNGTIVLNY